MWFLVWIITVKLLGAGTSYAQFHLVDLCILIVIYKNCFDLLLNVLNRE
jgi:hypothetical protein